MPRFQLGKLFKTNWQRKPRDSEGNFISEQSNIVEPVSSAASTVIEPAQVATAAPVARADDATPLKAEEPHATLSDAERIAAHKALLSSADINKEAEKLQVNMMGGMGAMSKAPLVQAGVGTLQTAVP